MSYRRVDLPSQRQSDCCPSNRVPFETGASPLRALYPTKFLRLRPPLVLNERRSRERALKIFRHRDGSFKRKRFGELAIATAVNPKLK